VLRAQQEVIYTGKENSLVVMICKKIISGGVVWFGGWVSSLKIRLEFSSA
jgi:hypothetical protein